MAEGNVDFRILGSLEVAKAGVPLDLGPHKQRSLLALLLINANHTVSSDRILEELWGDDAEGKENALWVYISRIRSALGDEPSPLVTRDGGYSLTVDPGSVDFLRFESEAVSGRTAMRDDPQVAAETLRTALSLWRGDVLEDFRYEEFAQAEIHRLEELRQTALEDRIEADLRLGGSGELVGDLDALIDGDPLAERPISLKMMALYRAGRQAEALRTFERFRRTIGEEMGLEPSPELVRLEEQILLHDSRLQTTMRSRFAVMPTEHATNPFKGLQPFQEADADRFFGRDKLVAEVIRRVADQRLVTLVGPSGSGKSSVVRAGVIPAIRKNAIAGSDTWLVARMVPGSRPFAELEAALLRSTIDVPDSLSEQLQGDEAGILRAALRVLPEDTSKILIVIDQFEELFTLVDDEQTRTRFLDGLTEAVNEPHGRVRVLLTLRADFYDRPLQYPAFGARMGDGVVNVVPMSPDELEHAAEAPAARAGITIEAPLLATLLTDVIGQPGALPLFQYTLTELFDRRADGTLDLATYEDMGGLRGTLTRRADELFAELAESEQAAARQLFLRLVAIADTDEWSRRRVAASEIIALDVDVVDLQAVVGAYGAARLLTFDRDHVSGSPTVEVAHEALLTEWDRLREWIDEARDDILRQTRLAAAGTEWRTSGDNPDYLLTGSRLDEYEAWAALTTLSLTVGERAYLEASVAERETIAAVEEDRVAREAALGRRARRRLWGLAAAVAVLLAVGLFFVIPPLLPEGPRVVLFTIADDPFEDGIRLGFQRAAAVLAVDEEVVPIGGDPVADLRAISQDSPALIITGPNVANVVAEVAPDFPDVKYAVMDPPQGWRFDELANVTVPVIDGVSGSYLMGIAAALKTETGVVGVVSVQMEGMEDFVAGYMAGVEATDPSVQVLARWIGAGDDGRNGNFLDLSPFEDPALGSALADELIAEDADVIYSAAGRSGAGVLAAVAEASNATDSPLWAIGVDADEFVNASEAERAVLLTSMIKSHEDLVVDVVRSFLSGEFVVGEAGFDVTTGHVGFSPLGAGVTDVEAQLQAARDELVSGSIAVPATTIDLVPGWLKPDVTVDVRFDGEACVIDGEPDISIGDEVAIRWTNDSGIFAGFSFWVDGSNVTVDEITQAPDSVELLAPRARLQGFKFAPPGGAKVLYGLATRDQIIMTCFDPSNAGGSSLADILPVAPITTTASAAADSYFAAYNAGNAEAVQDLFAIDATFGELTRGEWELLLAWNLAQGTQLTFDDCRTTAGASSDVAIVNCVFGTHRAVTQTVGAEPVSTRITMIITPDGITEIVETTSTSGSYFDVGGPFGRWVLVHHESDRDLVGVGSFLSWTSTDEASESGLLTRRLAEEWAVYLDERGCTYLDGC